MSQFGGPVTAHAYTASAGGLQPAPRRKHSILASRRCPPRPAAPAWRRDAVQPHTWSASSPPPLTGAFSCTACARARLRSAAATAVRAQDTETTATDNTLRVSLPTKEAQRSIKFTLARAGRDTAVLIDRLADGTAAAEAGVRPGQRLLSISDPMSGGMWALNDRPSIRFVRDALAMRSADTIDLVLSRESVYNGLASPSTDSEGEEAGASALESLLQPSDSDDDASAGSGQPSVAEQLAHRHRDSQVEAAAQRSAFERRQARRREHMERETARDDGAFFATTAAVILLPAIGILAVAYFSGYLDRLSGTYGGSF